MQSVRPGWWHVRAAHRKAELDAAIVRLRALVPDLPDVEGILVFGSYARGEVGPTSDLDLIVIQRSELPQMLRTFELYPKLRIGVAFDAIVYTPEEFERLRESRAFVAQAMREGFWLHAT
ncbi:MAG: nucleotidyltransferase domain-containing protein [Vulcanimicrobiaceae bacterium]